MMHTEIVKIIEGGLAGDKDKVFNYAKTLSDNLVKSGDDALAKKIKRVLQNRTPRMASLDSLGTVPVDIESRIGMVDIEYIDNSTIFLNKNLSKQVGDFIEYYRKRDEILAAGVDSINSLLLYGPPGCGKTTLAHYVAQKVQLPLVTARLDSMVSSLLGSTAKNIRKVFEYAERNKCVLFLDEFDVIAKQRDDNNELGELKRVVNSLIQNIDNYDNDGILIAATNHQQLLDSAIWRRFNTVINMVPPEKEDITHLLHLYMKDIPNNILNNKKIENLISMLEDFSHSNIKSVIQNCIKQAIVNNKKNITYIDFIKEIYIFKHHLIEEDSFIQFLIEGGAGQKEINNHFGYPLRKIRTIAKEK